MSGEPPIDPPEPRCRECRRPLTEDNSDYDADYCDPCMESLGLYPADEICEHCDSPLSTELELMTGVCPVCEQEYGYADADADADDDD